PRRPLASVRWRSTRPTNLRPVVECHMAADLHRIASTRSPDMVVECRHSDVVLPNAEGADRELHSRARPGNHKYGRLQLTGLRACATTSSKCNGRFNSVRIAIPWAACSLPANE